MWFSNIFNEYDSILNQNTPYISTNDIIFIIQDQKFNIKQYKKDISPNIERKKSMPLINVSFHYHILRDNNIPTLSEFINDYERDNKSFIKLMPKEWYDSILYILVRSYPSLVRDIHFVSKTRELGYDTIRTLQLDLYGIDAIIPIDDNKLFFRLFFDSKKSRKYLKNKKKSHNLVDCIDFGLNNNNREKIGDIFLYSEKSIIDIIEKQKVFISVNNNINKKGESNEQDSPIIIKNHC